jgi:hypothetical protein
MFKLSLVHIIDGAVLLSFFIALRIIRGYRRRRGLPYPPGPPGFPLIGNHFDIPSKFPWLAFTDYSKKYGMVAFSTGAFLFSEARWQGTSHPTVFRQRYRYLERH